MAAAQRHLARLPLEIFEPLVVVSDSCSSNAQELRHEICQKLQSFPRKARNRLTTYDSIRTVGALLQLSIPLLFRVLDPLLTFEQCHELVHRISRHCVPSSVTAWSILHNNNNSNNNNNNSSSTPHHHHHHLLLLPTCLKVLNDHLLGGLRLGTITELVGPAGVGKTQFAMTVVAQNALLYQRGTIYVDTEDKLSVVRLKEIVVLQQQQQQQQQQTATESTTNSLLPDDDDVGHVLTNVTTQTPCNTEELLSCLQSLEEQIILRNDTAATATSAVATTAYPVNLVIVDSIAAPLRRDFGTSAPQRASAVIACAQILKRIAHEQNVAVLVINQIDTLHQRSTTTCAKEERTVILQHQPQASLGTAWHHCVSTRILLEQQQAATNGNDNSNPQHHQHSSRRSATVIKSNVVGPGGPFPFQITGMGIVDVTL